MEGYIWTWRLLKMSEEEFENYVELEADKVDKSLESLESAMRKMEGYMQNDEVRPSVLLTDKAIRNAYTELVEAHPFYELEE